MAGSSGNDKKNAKKVRGWGIFCKPNFFQKLGKAWKKPGNCQICQNLTVWQILANLQQNNKKAAGLLCGTFKEWLELASPFISFRAEKLRKKPVEIEQKLEKLRPPTFPSAWRMQRTWWWSHCREKRLMWLAEQRNHDTPTEGCFKGADL